MSKGFKSDLFWEKQKIAMGEKVGRIKAFKLLQDTACLHQDERKIIAFAQIVKILNPNAKSIELIDTKIIPSIRLIGMAKWYRTEISDLSLALSKKTQKTVRESTKNVLDET